MANTPSPSDAFKALIRFGFATKGVVYLLMGVLALLAALGQGGQTADKKKAVQTLQDLPGGSVLLGLIAVGMTGYVLWKLVEAVRGEPGEGGAKQVAKRAYHVLSALIYGGLAWFAAQLAWRGHAEHGEHESRSLVAKVLTWPGGRGIVMAVAVVVIGAGIYQMVKAYLGKFREEVNGSELSPSQRTLVYRAGQAGFTARGVVIALIGYFLLRAGWSAQPSAAGGTEQAFDLLASMSSWALGLVALGLSLYGVYMLVRARYPLLKAV